MNFFDVTLDGDRLVGDVFEYPIGDDVRVDLGETADLVMGIRPEAIKLVASKSDAHEFEMTVDVVEPMGDENTVYLHFDPDADPESAATLVATIDGFTQVSGRLGRSRRFRRTRSTSLIASPPARRSTTGR